MCATSPSTFTSFPRRLEVPPQNRSIFFPTIFVKISRIVSTPEQAVGSQLSASIPLCPPIGAFRAGSKCRRRTGQSSSPPFSSKSLASFPLLNKLSAVSFQLQSLCVLRSELSAQARSAAAEQVNLLPHHFRQNLSHRFHS